VDATVYTTSVSAQFQLDVQKHNAQYPAVTVKTFTRSHDRFLLIDDDVYHIGASLKEVLNYKLFDDIPDNALCYITLVRGNLENIELEDDKTYLAAGESHAVLPFVLIRSL
jgi:hypothetical protein